MNKATRALVMTGMAAVAGATMSATAASVASAAPATPASASTTAKVNAPASFRFQTVGYYRSARACFAAGHFGDSRGWWDSFRCVRIWAGPYRSGWALTVDRDYFGGGHGREWNSWNSWNDGRYGHGDWDNGRNNGWYGGVNRHVNVDVHISGDRDGKGNGNGNVKGDRTTKPVKAVKHHKPVKNDDPTATATAVKNDTRGGYGK